MDTSPSYDVLRLDLCFCLVPSSPCRYYKAERLTPKVEMGSRQGEEERGALGVGEGEKAEARDLEAKREHARERRGKEFTAIPCLSTPSPCLLRLMALTGLRMVCSANETARKPPLSPPGIPLG